MTITTFSDAAAATGRWQTPPRTYEFTVSDRLRKLLVVNNVSVEQAAEVFGVTRQTIGRWINGRGPIDRRTLKAWGQEFAVPLEWIESGVWPAGFPEPDPERRASDYSSVGSGRVVQLRPSFPALEAVAA